MDDQLLEIIRSVRRRWRVKLAMRGVAATAACGAAALILAAWGLQWMRFTPESILLFRSRSACSSPPSRISCWFAL